MIFCNRLIFEAAADAAVTMRLSLVPNYSYPGRPEGGCAACGRRMAAAQARPFP